MKCSFDLAGIELWYPPYCKLYTYFCYVFSHILLLLSPFTSIFRCSEILLSILGISVLQCLYQKNLNTSFIAVFLVCAYFTQVLYAVNMEFLLWSLQVNPVFSSVVITLLLPGRFWLCNDEGSLRYSWCQSICKKEKVKDIAPKGLFLLPLLSTTLCTSLLFHGYFWWKNEASRTFSLISKSCLDIDSLLWALFHIGWTTTNWILQSKSGSRFPGN